MQSLGRSSATIEPVTVVVSLLRDYFVSDNEFGDPFTARILLGRATVELPQSEEDFLLQISQDDFDFSHDIDNDGITNIEEFRSGTNPWIPEESQ